MAEIHTDLADKAKAAVTILLAIESVLVDVHREPPRDVLRNPAGLDDTLVDLINTVAVSDTSPTAQADAVSRELIANVASVKLDAVMVGDIAAINAMAAERSVAHIAG